LTMMPLWPVCSSDNFIPVYTIIIIQTQRYIKNPLPYQRQRILERKIPKKGDFLVFLSRECYSPTLMAL
uniref:hypothetical protein n=1 Tax=Prevotella sp. TaxID=59823 RepID=UPI004024D97C